MRSRNSCYCIVSNYGRLISPLTTMAVPFKNEIKNFFSRYIICSTTVLTQVVLSLSPGSVSAKYRSGGEDITRPLSSGVQEYNHDDTTMPPLYQPFPKLGSILQCSGKVGYFQYYLNLLTLKTIAIKRIDFSVVCM